jgi:HEAT repeats
MSAPRPWKTLAAAGALVVVAFAAIRLASGPPPAPAPDAGVAAARGAALQLGSGARAYRLSQAIVIGAGQGAPLETTLEGVLNVRMIGSAARPAMAVQVSPMEVRVGGERRPILEAVFAKMFVIDVEVTGQLGETRFGPGLAAGDRATLDAALRPFQVVLPPGRGAEWETRERDQHGAFVAAYRLEGDGRTIAKRKLRYEGPRATIFPVRVDSSSLRAEVDAEGPWLRSAVGAEQLTIGGDAAPVIATASARFALEALPRPPDPTLELWREDLARVAVVPVRDASDLEETAWDASERERQRDRLAKTGVTLESLLASVSTRARRDPSFHHELALYLRIHPDDARRVSARIRALGSSDEALFLVQVLRIASTPQAQRALAELAHGRDVERQVRVAALAALGDVVRPRPETLDRVARTWSANRGREEASAVAGTAVLALGSMTARVPPDVRPRYEDLLREALASTSPREEALVLHALGNARATLPPDALARYLASPDAAVREAAARVATGRQGEAASPEILGRLSDDPAPSVRRAVMRGLIGQPPDPATNAAVVQALASAREADPRVRSQMVEYLARNKATFPGNTNVLRAALQSERDRQVVTAILNALAR